MSIYIKKRPAKYNPVLARHWYQFYEVDLVAFGLTRKMIHTVSRCTPVAFHRNVQRAVSRGLEKNQSHLLYFDHRWLAAVVNHTESFLMRCFSEDIIDPEDDYDESPTGEGLAGLSELVKVRKAQIAIANDLYLLPPFQFEGPNDNLPSRELRRQLVEGVFHDFKVKAGLKGS